MTENQRKAELIKKGLAIVNELAELDIKDIYDLEDLIEKAEKLKKNILWKLK